MSRIADLTRMPPPRSRALRLFFLSFILCVVALAAAGHLVSGVNYFKNFSRFHLYLNPSTLYYPTASQAIALAKEAGDAQKIVVIIGGSSVMWGAAQSDAELWTHQLQRDLGDRYKVLNLALPSGSPQEHGNVATQYLLKHGYQVIYLSDLGGTLGSPDGLFYPYVYWDAYYKGYLFPNPEADPLINQLGSVRTVSPPLDELKARAALDSVLYFTDFWSVVGYKLFFSTWNYLVYPPAGYFFTPREHFVDLQDTYPIAQRFTNPPFDLAMSITRAYVTMVCPVDPGPGGKASVDAYWSSWDASARVAFPSEVRPNIMFTRVMHARPYRDALSEEERRCYAQSFSETSTRLHALGYGSAELGQEWTDNDYVDVVHPSAPGGVKMAAELAPRIRELARELRYTE